MAIDLSGYYSYLNTISSNLTQNIDAVKKSDHDLSTSKETSSDFEMAFLSMLDRSKSAYAKIAENGGSTAATENLMSSLDTQDSGTALYNNLTQILESYDSMKASSSLPKSIQESLFDTLNGNDQEDTSSAYSSELNISSLLQKAEDIVKTIK